MGGAGGGGGGGGRSHPWSLCVGSYMDIYNMILWDLIIISGDGCGA